MDVFSVFFFFFSFFHIADQATDIGAVIEFRQLQLKNRDNICQDKYDIDPAALFYFSLFALLFYKFVSAAAIYSLTYGNWTKTIRQFLDIEIYRKKKKINVFLRPNIIFFFFFIFYFFFFVKCFIYFI